MRPGVSALLTTHNRAHFLPRVLDGLKRQTLPQSQFEIVVIDDGSIDDSQNVLASYAGILPLRIFHQGASGLATAKNLGIYAARAPILVFLDDDDVLDPNALGVHLAAHLANPDPSVAVLAHTTLDSTVAKSPLMMHVTETCGQLFSYKWIETGKVLGYREFWGGRSSCKREFLLKHGVFNPIFRFGYEDIELGWRLQPRGLRVIYEPAASATMIRSISFEDFCRRSIRQGRSLYIFNQLHAKPEIEAYCEIENSLALWTAHWRNYAAIRRYAARLDEVAAGQLLSGETLTTEFQKELDAAYALAFALSRAKGVADAAWLDTATPPVRRKGYGLAGDFASVKQKIYASTLRIPARAVEAASGHL